MNPRTGKTSVKVTMKVTWKLRLQCFLIAFQLKPYVTLVDYDVKEVSIREEAKDAVQGNS